MPGELSIQRLLETLKVTMHRSTFVFLTIPPTQPLPVSLDNIQMTFLEREGLTLVIDKLIADRGNLEGYTFASKMITCDVHSSLEAVGFMAVIADKLARAGIGCNPVSGFFHDHIFVPEEKADDAVTVLESMAREARGEPR